MLTKNLLYLLGALMLILWAGQPVQAQSAAGNAAKEKTCPELWPVTQDGKWGYIDQTGRLIIPCKFESAADFSEGLAAVDIKEKTGYIDKTGKVVIPPRFLSGYPFSGGMALVVIREFKKDRYHMHQLGYINRSGKLVIRRQEALDSKSLHISSKDLFFSEGLLNLTHNNKAGFIDKTGKQVISPRYADAHPFYEGLAAVKISDKYGYIDKSGKMVIPPQFESAGLFSDGLAYVFAKGKHGYIDKSGKMVFEGEEYEWVREFSEGLAAARGKNDKYGFIDKTGKFAIPPQFARVGNFSEGLAAVQPVDAGWPGNLAYINAKGEIVIKSMSTFPNSPMRTEFDLHHYRFCGGVARVSLGNEADEDADGYINREGKFIWPQVTPSKKE
ncbi:MAG: WG repeat-containing protein [Desulfobaccales bacterium]